MSGMPLSFSILFDVYGRLSEGLGLLQFVDGQIELWIMGYVIEAHACMYIYDTIWFRVDLTPFMHGS